MMMGTMMNDKNIGSDQTNNTEGLVMPSCAFRMMEKELEVLIIRTLQRVIEPKMENLIRKVVKEEFRLAQEKLMVYKSDNVTEEASTSRSGSFELQFLEKVASPVLTGKEIKGVGGAPLGIALVDVSTGQIVESGPEASAEVELVVHEENHKDHMKKRPILSQNIIRLKKGSVHLGNTKFKHEKSWMKSCDCTLVARVVENTGIRVQEAKSGLFTLMDSRNKLYEKHYPPSLLDHVWRLENISKNGALHKRLSEAEIMTVKDFLISLFLDPENLRKILDTNATTWKLLIDHAQTCSIDDEKVHLYPYGDGETLLVFDVVGRLKGILQNYQYILVDTLSEIEKGEMLKCIKSAFKHWESIETLENEASLVHSLSQISNGFSSQNLARINSPNGWNIDMEHTQPSTSSQYSVPSLRCFSRTTSFGYCGSLNTLNNLDDQPLSSLDQVSDCTTFDVGMVVEDTWLLSFDNNCHPGSEDFGMQYHGHQESSASDFHVVDVGEPLSEKQMSITRRIVNMIGAHAQKKQRHC